MGTGLRLLLGGPIFLLIASLLGVIDEWLGAGRLPWLTRSVVFAMARWARDTPAKARTRASMNGLIEQLTAYGAAGLTAPDPSVKTPATDPVP